jgi:hypothetical protein
MNAIQNQFGGGPRRPAGPVASCAAGVAALLACAAIPGRGALAAEDRGAVMDKSFNVLLQKSIFSRDRARNSGASATTAPAVARVLSPEQSVAFRGVLCPDEEYVAFVENVQTRQISIVKVGDEIARGRVAAITLDTLAYDSGGKVHQIHLGQDLTGETASSGGGGYSTGSPAGFAGTPGATPGAAATASPAAGDPAQQAIIERLRQKRLQEGNR